MSLAQAENSHLDLADKDDLAVVVERAAAGNAEAWADLYHHLRPILYQGIFTMLKDHKAVEDVLQNTFAKANTHIHTIKDFRCFPAWMQTVARNFSVRYYRKMQKHQLSQQEIPSWVPDTQIPLPEEKIVADEVAAQIHAVLLQLNDIDRQALHLFYFKDLTLKEMADELDRPLGTVKRRLFVARARLKVLLEDQFIR